MTDRATIAAAAELLGGHAAPDEPLGPRTTYRVGGRAALLMTVDDEAALELLAVVVGATAIDVLVVGKGSNLLVADAGFPGLAVVLGDSFASVEIDGTGVRAGAAASLPVVARQTVTAGLAGFEWAVGVPGSVGGAVRMNAGGHGSDLAASLVGIRVVDLRTGEDGMVEASALDLGYRRSAVLPHQLVLGADLRLREGDAARGAAELREIVAWRRANQPGGQNAGSVFTNPPGDSAGRLIDAAGCQRPADRQRPGVHEARQLHPGRRGRPCRRRGDPHDRGRRARRDRQRRAPPSRDPPRGLPAQPSTRHRGFGMSTTSPLRGAASIDPRIKARRIAVQRGVGRRRLQRLVELALLVAVAGAFLAALRSPLLDVEAIEVSGAERTPVADVRERLGIRQGQQLVDVDLGAAGERLAALPWVEAVRLDRRLDGTVAVRLTERRPIAVVGPPGNEHLVDRDGRVLGSAALAQPDDGPLVRVAGVDGPVAPGAQLDRSLRDALAVAGLLASAAPGAASEVSAAGGDLTVALAVGGSARFGDATRLDAKVTSLLTFLEQVDLACLDVLDLRLPTSPVLTREESCS